MSIIKTVQDFYGLTPAPVNGSGAHVATGSEEDTAYGMAALAGECEAVARAAEGTRNATLNAAAYKIGRVIAAGKLTPATAAANLAAAGRACGLPVAEVELILRANSTGALSAGQGNPRVVEDLPEREEITSWLPTDAASTTDMNGPTGTALDAEPPRPTVPSVGDSGPSAPADGSAHTGTELDLDAAVRKNLPALDWRALWADESEEEWIVEPLLPARRLVALYSPPKVGKSLLLLEIAVSVSRGTEILGVVPDRPRRVLYVDFENDPKADIRERLQDMRMKPEMLDGLSYLSFPNLAALDSDRGGRELMAAVEVYACEVVVIDTVSRSIAGEENENDTWLNFYRHTGLRLKQSGVALIRLDHTGKDEAKGQRGGSAKSGDVDAVWRMSKVADDTFRLDCEANRMPVAEKTLVLHREAGPLRHRVDAAGRSAVWKVKLDAAIAAMDAVDLPIDAGSTRARDVIRAAGIKARNDLIAAAIKARKTRISSVPDWRGPVPENYRSPMDGDRWGPMGEE